MSVLDEEKVAKIIGRTGAQVGTDSAEIAAVIELLIEKGIFTKEEFDKKYEQIESGEQIKKLKEFLLGSN